MILDVGSDLFLSDAGITNVEFDAERSMCAVEVLGDRASVVY